FVSNGAWLDGNSADGFRKCLEKEFSAVYLFNLRGNQRTSGELSRKEGGKIFGSGSRTPVSVILLVKNPEAKQEKAVIHYHDIGDYLSREEKLSIVKDFQSVGNPAMPWRIIQPNEQGDWINRRNDAFANFIPMGDKKDKSSKSFFESVYSRGLSTARDAWCYNSSYPTISNNINSFVDFYNNQREKFHQEKKAHSDLKVEDVIEFNSKKITWNRGLKKDLKQNQPIKFKESNLIIGMYRPFYKQHLYLARELNDMVYQIPKLFPAPELDNLVICVSGLGGNKDNTAIITDCIPDLNCLDAGTQCFPLYWYEKPQEKQLDLFSTASGSEHIRRDGISDFIFKRAKKQYGKSVTKEDIFYYVYGILHSPEYRTAFANDLKKMLPRLPLLDKVADFWAFSKAGRALADLHINYETVPPCDGVTVTGADSGFFRVEKMRFPKKDGMVRGTKKKVNDTGTIHFNSKITLSDIPKKAYQYVVNGKSAVEWIMERYQVKTDKKSG
ncbi:MAG: helicase, partial [Candidatus Electrothrix sp. AX1]|nr:helicase [Candidatus Electrothrix sp. AX1]